MTGKIKEIVESIKAQDNVLYAVAAFRLFIDNQITEDELIEVLAADGHVLPDNFKDLPIREKKNYYNTVQTRIYFENNEPKTYSYVVFNKPYFYELAEQARKTKIYTNQLVEYMRVLGEHNVNLLFLGMQYIKIANTHLTRFKSITDYIDSKQKDHVVINDLYSLLISVFSEQQTPENKALRNLLTEKIGKETFLGFDIDPKHKDKLFCLFALYIECYLSLLPRKEANTIKIKFKVLSPDHLRDIDYYQDIDRQNRILNTFKKKAKSDRLFTQISGLVISNQEIFDQFNPNGYTAIYYYLMEEGV